MADSTQVPPVSAGNSFQNAALRLLRMIVAQIPFIITWMQGNPNPKWVAFGVFLNAVMKFLRDMFPQITWIPA